MTERMKNMISAIKSSELEGAVFSEQDMRIFKAVGEGRMSPESARQFFIKQALQLEEDEKIS